MLIVRNVFFYDVKYSKYHIQTFSNKIFQTITPKKKEHFILFLIIFSYRIDIETPQHCLSNPVTLNGSENTTFYIIFQDVGGQVFMSKAEIISNQTPNLETGKWLQIGGELSFNHGK